MTKALRLQLPNWRSAAMAIPVASALLFGICGQASALNLNGPMQGPFPALQSPTVGQSFITSRGSGFVTGNVGSLETTTVPGSTGQGFLMNNGNGTSTLLSAGAVPQVVVTPR